MIIIRYIYNMKPQVYYIEILTLKTKREFFLNYFKYLQVDICAGTEPPRLS